MSEGKTQENFLYSEHRVMSNGVQEKKSKINRDLIALSKLAHRKKKEGRYKEAEENFRLALKIDENNVYILVGLGDLKRLNKEFKEAIHYYQLEGSGG